jgi:hypothetical protein
VRERVYYADEKMAEELVTKAGILGEFERIICYKE